MVSIKPAYNYLFHTIEKKLTTNLEYVVGGYNLQTYRDDLDQIKRHCRTNPEILFEIIDSIYTNVIESGDDYNPEKIVDALLIPVRHTELFRISRRWRIDIKSFMENEHLRQFLECLAKNVIIKICKCHNIYNREKDLVASLPSLVKKEYRFRHLDARPQKKTH